MSSWLLDSSPGTFQICLRKFAFCLSFERYHITRSLSRLNIWSSVVSVELFTMFDILSNSFTLIVVYKGLCLKLWTLRLYYLDILPEHLVQRKCFFFLFIFFYDIFGQRIWFMVIFFLSKRSTFCSKYKVCLLQCHIFCSSSCYYGKNYENVLQPF